MRDLLRLLTRQVRSDRGVAVLLALVVLATVGLTTAALRLSDRAATDDVRAAVGNLAPVRRDATGALDMGADIRIPGLVPDALATAAAPLGDLAGAPVWALRMGPLTAEARPGVDNVVTVRIGEGWPQRMRLVAGRLPAAAQEEAPKGVPGSGQEPRPVVVLDVALTRAAATAMSLRLGQSFNVAPWSAYVGSDIRLHVAGLVEPVDRADGFWADEPWAFAPRVTYRDPRSTVEGTVFAGVDALPVLARNVLAGPRLVLRVPLRPDAVATRPLGEVIAALRRVNSTLVPVAPDVGGVRLASALESTLLAERARREPLQALTAVLVAVLLAAAVGAVVLGARLLVHRRSGALALARARGASGGQLLGVLAAEGLLLGVPPAVLALFLAGRVPDGGVLESGGQSWRLLLAVAVGLTPAVALAGAGLRLVVGGPAGAGGSVARRLAARHGAGAAIVLLVAAAVLAAVALRSRGVDAAAATDDSGADLLVVVAPVLVAAAVAVLVARGVGPLLAVVVALLTRLRGGVVFLGAARAARERSAAGVALVAMALTVTAGMLAATADATVREGTTVAAARATGADLRVGGLGFTDAEQAGLARVPGVADVAAWADPEDAALTGPDGARTSIPLVATQPDRLASVQQDLPSVSGFPAAVAAQLTAATAAAGPVGKLPVVVSQGVAAPGADLALSVAGRPVPATVVVTSPAFPGVQPGDGFVVADLAALRARTGLVIAPPTLLVRTSATGPSEAALRKAVPSLASTSSLRQTAERSTDAPVVRAVRAGLPLALAVGAGLAALTAVLALLLGARERGRFLAHLRALGLSGRQSAALVALEALPAGVAGLVAGSVAGLGLTWLLLPASDLRALTGAVDPPAVVVPVTVVLGVAGAFAVVIALAVAVAVVAGRSVSPVEAARTVEAG